MKKILIVFVVFTIKLSAQEMRTMTFTMDGSGITMNSNIAPEPKEIGDGVMEFIYDYRYLTDSLNVTSQKSELMVMQTSYNIAKFSSLKQMQIDSMLRVATSEEIMAAPARFGGGDPYALFKNYPQGKFTTIDRISTDWIRVEEDIELPKWELKGETKEILGYICRRAETTFKGRKWIAWYTDAITVTIGPWKLDGLPGLVCKASDSEEHYSFTLVGMTTTTGSKITIPNTKFNNTSIEKYYKAKRNYIENPLAAINSNGIQVTITDESGKPKSEADLIHTMKYDFIER